LTFRRVGESGLSEREKIKERIPLETLLLLYKGGKKGEKKGKETLCLNA